MAASPRGPYSQIRWFCADGTIQPPVPYACSERGGGRQHAQYSARRDRLAELGWSVGTVFAALAWDELFDSQPRQQRLRELPLERYLTDIDDGWVLRRAKSYRGRVQVEDEAAAGRELLLQLLADASWVRGNFLLARESVRTVPHGEDSDLSRTVRRVAVELAELEPAAERWRVEIHTSPDAGTAARLRAWATQRARPEVVALATRLADDLDALYGPAGRRARTEALLGRVGSAGPADAWRRQVRQALAAPAAGRVSGLCSALAAARSDLFAALKPARRLALLDALDGLEIEVRIAFTEAWPGIAGSRASMLRTSRELLDCGIGTGLLSEGEVAALREATGLGTGPEVSLAAYREAVNGLKRAPGWAVGTIRHTFAEALTRYAALDPRAARFSDDLLRGSPLQLLGEPLAALARDVDRLGGGAVEIAGRRVATAVALNAGSARGTLRIFESIEAVGQARLEPSDIVVIPETIAELGRVSGILTLGEGNPLSHVQLLARNLGIPNVAIDQTTADLLRPLQGRRIVLIVGSRGDVLLAEETGEPARLLADAGSRTTRPDSAVVLPTPELAMRRPLPLAEIGRELSGRVVGPKAANLGELNRLFPGRVAPAIGIPFGIYEAHLREAGLSKRIAEAFAGRADGSLTAAEFDAEIAGVRGSIAGLALQPAFRAQLVEMMAREFGPPGTYGVFVRSDTNVEDLPQFTGAGLNETIPNVRGLDAQLAAIPRVWSSVLSPRALAWRSNVLANPAQVFASVLLMKSVPSTKSGVLVTTNLFDPGAIGLTVSTGWGVGGTVAGEAAETLVLRPESVQLVSESKSPYRRLLGEAGGVQWAPAPAGRVLEPGEIGQLRVLVEQVREKTVPALDESGRPRPWDIEFGFVDGELTLFQIRPLVERSTRDADALIAKLRPSAVAGPDGSRAVRLDEPPAGGGVP